MYRLTFIVQSMGVNHMIMLGKYNTRIFIVYWLIVLIS